MAVTQSPDRPIIVTGANGFVGKYLMAALRKAKVPAANLLSLSASGAPSSYAKRHVQADISDYGKISSLLQEIQPSAIIHLAAVAEPARARADKARAWQVNFEGTRNLAEALLKYTPDARMIFAGSSEAYGASFNIAREPIPESTALRPMSSYGATKAAADIMLGQLAYEGLDIVRFRAFNHTGPGQTEAYVVPAFARQVARIEAGLQLPVLAVGNLDAERDFLDVRDVVQAYVAALKFSGTLETDAVYNISSGQARTIRSILTDLLALSQKEIAVETDPNRLRPSDVPYAAGDNERARVKLKWTPHISFVQTLRDTLQSCRQSVVSIQGGV